MENCIAASRAYSLRSRLLRDIIINPSPIETYDVWLSIVHGKIFYIATASINSKVFAIDLFSTSSLIMFSITASALLKVVLASTTIFQTVTTNDQIILSDGTSQILNITGMISVKNSTHDIGYVSNGRATEFHPYQYTTVIDNALRVSVNVSSRDPIDLLTLVRIISTRSLIEY